MTYFFKEQSYAFGEKSRGEVEGGAGAVGVAVVVEGAPRTVAQPWHGFQWPGWKVKEQCWDDEIKNESEKQNSGGFLAIVPNILGT